MGDETTTEPTRDAAEAEQPQAGEPDGTPAAAQQTPPDTDEDDNGGAPPRNLGDRLVLSNANLEEVGLLRLHLRTGAVVEVLLDGDAAMRLLFRLKHGPSADPLTDRLSPARSSATNSWLVLLPDDVVVAQWLPGVPQTAPHGVSIDPAA